MWRFTEKDVFFPVEHLFLHPLPRVNTPLHKNHLFYKTEKPLITKISQDI